MALCTVNWRSEVIGKWTAMHVLLPEKAKPPFATLYLLHGMSDDYTIWLRQTRIEMYARQWPLMVVMPDGYRGFYTKNADGPDYARHFGEELLDFVERNFRARRAAAARCIGGLSMGGYGALQLALAYPHKFRSVNSHSGALLHGAKRYDKPTEAELRRVFGRRPAGSRHDLLRLARKAAAEGHLPRIRIDCGTEDFLLADNRRFHAQLGQAGIGHEYAEFPGSHNWDYWDLHVREALAFHAKALGLKKLSAW
jgi:S-formylglutathione hydrolase FrmB